MRAENCHLYDHKGKKFIDTFAANGNVIVGHAANEVVEAYANPDKNSDRQLLEFLRSLLPGYFDTFTLCKSGTIALKLACEVSRKYRNKPYVLAISEDIISNSFLVLSAGEDHDFTPVFSIDTHFELVNHNLHHPPVVGQKRLSALGKSCKGACLCSLESFFSELADKTAAIIIEPSIGVGGSIEPCRNFFGKLRNFCDINGIDLISNETQCGLGRTGSRMFGFQLLNITPDIVCLGPNMGNGYPIGAAIFSERFSELTETANTANLSSCAAALATLRLVLHNKLYRKSEQLGEFIKKSLHSLLDDFHRVINIRGLGLMIEIELNSEEIAAEVHNRSFERGLITGIGSIRKKIIRLTPPLVFSGSMAELACKILGETILEV
ncbi:MAG: putrescine aminotransferase [Candidatus Rifleibacteriota bacterium]